LGVLHNPTCIGTDRHTGPENFPTTSIQLTLGGIYSDERLRPNILLIPEFCPGGQRPRLTLN